tara:strand:+ start:21822 stop:23774 length:1953 start_codon:yes stop_codon:yes gene_type:complete
MQQYKPGDQIGGEFKVLEVFGGVNESGMGVVYLVEHRESPFPHILKTYQNLLGENAKKQFVAEAHAWINAGANAHIVQAYWVREIAGQIYVAAEYVEPDEIGRNNLTHFLQGGQLLTEVVLMWAAQFCYGMDYARSKGVLAHRDIKPANLMIGKDGTLKVTDFGLAKSISPDAIEHKKGWPIFGGKQKVETAAKTKAGSIMGTPSYMAPEQFRDAKSADHRADIYSFGVILYEMVTGGGYPYRLTGESQNPAIEYCRAHLSQKPIAIDTPLMSIINKCLQKKPDRRYETYDTLLSDLHKVAKKLKLKIPRLTQVSKDDEELYGRAQSYVVLGDKDRALKAIDEYTKKYPNNFCGWTEKGRIHLERGELDDALAATRRSLDENPYNTHAWNNLGIILFRAKAPFDEVSSAYSNALRLDSLNTAAMMNFVGPLMLAKEYAEAAKLTAKAIAVAPNKPLLLAKAQQVLTDLKDARDLPSGVVMLEGWTKARPDDVEAWHNLGLFYMGQNKFEPAVPCFENVRRLDPNDEFALVQLAKLYFWTKNSKECLRCCDEMLKSGVEPVLAISTKARVLNFSGGYQQARNLLKFHLDNNPENDALWMVLADVHDFRDNFKDAAFALNRAKKILLGASGSNVRDNLKYVNEKLQQLARKN